MKPKALFHIDDLKDNCSKGLTLTDNSCIFAVKKSGRIYLYKNSCPHLGIELEWTDDQFLDSSDSLIQCSTHGALFMIEDGSCISGPCRGQSLQTINFHIADDGMVYLTSNQ